MDHYLTGTTIKNLREKKKITQAMLAKQIGVSDKTISKWETMKGLPDISLIESLAAALDVSLTELFAGECIINKNISGNMLRSKLYVCPVCGNVIHSLGEIAVSCCGVTLPYAETEESNPDHSIQIELVDGEYYISMNHPMTKQHYISFFAYTTSDKFEIKKIYPESSAEVRFQKRGHGFIYAYCNHHGLMQLKI